MLTLNKIKEDERIISYEYLPQDDLKKGRGKVTLNKKNSEVIEFILSKDEITKDYMIYRNKAFQAIRYFISKNEFPEEYLVAWY
ncbi:MULTISPECIES: hypothetical protein [Staphylococcus]|jgi:hypothetical protein|uniref:hypothetical protein n=1 Tax=Staphylococcus TaxID=1279 RepID=UPI00076AFE2D|nr:MULTISPECIES: hypothetical protein [Staphylococcus]AMG65010.1 hypothetical protein AL501_03805 [Staphylococcus lugdunensis]MCI2815867.1 hypothetical protein [Staphylococcus lugdunensis]MDU0967442.1 hypothetical protein [Staphylococcus lugdunensis]MDU2323063.1 hypothetical protein [Staphylococcus lugdunensis]MDU2404673.1 hypothetical protein [Staphylococcus lugdunensis]